MVSKIFGLSLLTALASTVNAYTWHATMITGPGRKFVIHPVDVQVPANDQALVWEVQFGASTPKPAWGAHGWRVYSCANSDFNGKKGVPVTPPSTTTTATPVPTTTCPVVTVTVPVTVTTTNPPKPTTTPPKPTTTPPKPSPTCLAGYKGKRNGKGPNGACCSHSDDCKDTCVKGVCGVHP
ncbi:MAG: hypothetical protein J3Q66DRAFT_356944 [Benniella sp.]|nr:MAG: hypothetical protein J3Q66DRAFT_356944 [Benniella sp.]